ncbi:MAG TPA: phosphotransferase family protein [Thermoanaerobaculia bacterium]|nr:phosphotransferase family protein [Thermoanaerobaculia bacterium]
MTRENSAPAPADELPASLARAVARRLGECRIEGLRRLSGGASQETWSFEAELLDADRRNPHHRDAELPGAEPAPNRTMPLILRRSPAGRRSAAAVTPEVEARVQQAAADGGVPAARVRFVLEPEDGLGHGYVMDRLAGESIAPRILRDPALAQARASMARRCGEILATLHAISADGLDLPVADGPRQIEQYRELYESFDEPRPLFDLAFRRLRDTLSAPGRIALVHGDFRNGNLLVGPDGIRAVLDWELTHRGDPMEDLGWLCGSSWRFGEVERPVGGFGALEDLFAGYEAVSGERVDRERVSAWQVFGTLKWGVMCMIQGFSHLRGEIHSVEKAAIGRRVSETEADLARLLAPEIEPEEPPFGEPESHALRDERPTARDLLGAVRGFLAEELRPTLEGKRSFDVLVAANALGIVERELAHGAEHDALERAGMLELLGGPAHGPVERSPERSPVERSTADLARSLAREIRSGGIDPADPRLLRFLRRSADRKLAIDNPRYRPVPVKHPGRD